MYRKGVTLIETIAVIGIIATVLAAINLMYIYGVKVYYKGTNSIQLQDSARAAINKIAYDVHNAQKDTIKTQPDSVENGKIILNGGIITIDVNNFEKFLVYMKPKDESTPCAYVIESINSKKELHKIYTDERDEKIIGNIDEVTIDKPISDSANYMTFRITMKLINNNEKRNYTTFISASN